MPATKLTRKYGNPVFRIQQMEQLIRVGMARKGIRTDLDLAHRLGLSQPAMSRRMTGECEWSFTELCRLVSVLDLGGEELGAVLGCSA